MKNRADTKTSNITKSQTSESTSSSECSISPWSNTGNVGVKETHDLNVTPAQFHRPRKVDGAFLTAGRGTALRSNRDFITRENFRVLEDTAVNPLSVAQLVDRTVRFQTSAGGLSNSIGRLSISEDGGFLTGVNNCLSSNPHHILVTQQSDLQSNFSFNIDHNSGSQYDRVSMQIPMLMPMLMPMPVPTTTPTPWPTPTQLSMQMPMPLPLPMPMPMPTITPTPWPTPTQLSMQMPMPLSMPMPMPMPFQRTMMYNPAHNIPSPLGSDNHTPTFFPSQPIHRQSFKKNYVDGSSGFSTTSHFDEQRGNSIRHSQLGRLIPLPDNRETQISGSLLPVHSQCLGNPSACIGTSVQPFTNSFKGSSQVSLDSHFNRLGSAGPSGQVIPVAKLGIPSRASPYRESLKRRARGTHLAPPDWSQRKKIIPQSVAHPYSPHQKTTPFPTSARTVHAPHHIKWQGFDEARTLTGHKCHLCKRDLSFTCEGSVYQPERLPVVAVLPCGHTFHDQCLKNITPADQSKYPPCLPCALGETSSSS